MKKILCLLFVLCLCLASCAAEEESLDFHESVLDYTVEYPSDLLTVYGVPEEEEGYNYDAFEPLSGEAARLTVNVLSASQWPDWRNTGFPALLTLTPDAQKVVVDEPNVEMSEVSMDMTFAAYRSADGTRLAETAVLESPTDDTLYVVVAQFPADDPNGWQETFEYMMETMVFPRVGARGGAFVLSYSFPGGMEIREITIDEEAEPFWLYADPAVKNFALEEVVWDDSTFTVTETKPLYETAVLSGEALRIRSFIPDMLPTLRVRCVDEEGDEEIWYITESGMDGHLMLVSEADILF